MDKAKAQSSKSSRTESDAVHPRFETPIDPAEMLKYEMEHHYFCNACKIFIAPTTLSLQIHFKREIENHEAYGVCFYCNGHTYSYKFNGNIRYYHSCRD